MLVFPSQNALAFKAKQPEMIQAVIPSSKRLDFKGHDLIVVPHGIEETKVLRNMGFPAPSPINYYYDYPKYQGKYNPFDHQRKTCDFVTIHNRCAILNSPRTGKTLSCLWAADYLMSQGLVRKVLIVSPLSTLHRVWADDIFATLTWRKFAVLYGSADKRRKLLAMDHDFYIVNHDGFSIIKDSIPEDVDLLIFDEAAVLRNPSTTRFRALYNFTQKRLNLRLWLLTGTPTPNEPTDAWSLMRLIGTPNLPRHSLFREQVMMKVGQWQWVPRPGAMEMVHQMLQPSIRFTREDCFDLPDTTYSSLECEMSKEQKKLFADLLKQFATEAKGQQVTAVNEAVKIQKLLQVLLGSVYTDDGNTATVDAGNRFEVIRETIEECDEKVLVFVPFTGALEALADYLRKSFSVEIINGNISANKRNEVFRAFQTTTRPRVLVADARTMSHGLDLTKATTIVWAGPTNSNETYLQANDRIKGPKQTKKTAVIHIESTDLERKVFQRLKNKQSMQGLLLDLIQKQDMM